MTKSEFKRALQRGLGRCVLELQGADDIEKYRRMILDCCLKNPSYDVQCEGTRAEYLYELASFYGDADYFLLPVLEKFKNEKHKPWDFSHYCDLIATFAYDGDERAHAALWQKYDELYELALNDCKGKDNSVRHGYEYVSITLTSLEEESAFLKIASDMGKLFEKNGAERAADYEWFFVNYGQKAEDKNVYGLLQKQKSGALKSFSDTMKSLAEKRAGKPKLSDTFVTADDILNARSVKEIIELGFRFSFTASEGEKKKLAQAIIAEADENRKAVLLKILYRDEFPLNHGEIVAYTQSRNARLRKVAWRILLKCRSEEVRAYALELIGSGNAYPYATSMLICNYREEDRELLLRLLNAYPITYSGKSGWHDAVSAVLDGFDEGVKLPREALDFVYEKSICSFCRECAVSRMAESGLLRDEVKEELRYDSNFDIREFAETLN